MAVVLEAVARSGIPRLPPGPWQVKPSLWSARVTALNSVSVSSFASGGTGIGDAATQHQPTVTLQLSQRRPR